MIRTLLIIAISFLFGSCHRQVKPMELQQTDSISAITTVKIKNSEQPKSTKSKLAQKLDSLDFINIAEADSTILIDLIYTRSDNFTGEVLYETLREAYLHPLAMESLLKANQLLKAKQPNYSLLVLDAARPMSIQRRMWDKVKGTPNNIYVSNPNKGGGMHNYGMAVDATIVDEHGKWLPMGTEFDHFGIEAHITNEEELVKQGKITTQERENRVLLRSIMREAGFIPLYNEWWHFNRLKREETITHYKLIK